MADSKRRDRSAHVLTNLAAFVIVVAGLKIAAPLLLPFLFAAFLAVVASPTVLWLERRGWRPGLAVIPAVVVVLTALVGFGAMLTASLDRFGDALPGYRAALEVMFEGVVVWLAEQGVRLPQTGLAELLDPGDMVDMVGNFAGAFVVALSNTMLVLFTMTFMLLELTGLRRKLAVMLGPDSAATMTAVSGVLGDVQRYLAIKTAISALIGTLVFVTCVLVGLDFALLWGLLAFLLNFIPNVGGFIAAIPNVLVALVQPDLGPGAALVVAVAHTAIHTVVGNVLEPAWMGRELGMSTLVVFLCLVFWGWVWGPVGMLLSVPLTMVARIMLEASDEGRPIAVLLGRTPAEPGLG